MLSWHNPSESCVSTKSTLSPFRCPNVWMTLSGGTTGLSFSIRLSNFFGAITRSTNDCVGFMITAWGDRAQKYVEWGFSVIAFLIAGSKVHDVGFRPTSKLFAFPYQVLYPNHDRSTVWTGVPEPLLPYRLAKSSRLCFILSRYAELILSSVKVIITTSAVPTGIVVEAATDGLTIRRKMKNMTRLAQNIPTPSVRCLFKLLAALIGVHLDGRAYGGGFDVFRGGSAKCMLPLLRLTRYLYVYSNNGPLRWWWCCWAFQ